jgi:hypothetical protein
LTSELASVRSLSERVLDALITESPDPARLADPRCERARQNALRYAEALVRQEEVLEAVGRLDSSSAPLQAALTGRDRDRITDFLLYRNIQGRFETLDSLTNRWDHTVAWVEKRAESLTHDEYVDRLIGRDWLDDALSLLAPTGRAALEVHVRSYDDRFSRATNELSASIKPPSPWRYQRWWWFRVPPRMGEHFRTRLESVAPAAAQEALAAEE